MGAAGNSAFARGGGQLAANVAPHKAGKHATSAIRSPITNSDSRLGPSLFPMGQPVGTVAKFVGLMCAETTGSRGRGARVCSPTCLQRSQARQVNCSPRCSCSQTRTKSGAPSGQSRFHNTAGNLKQRAVNRKCLESAFLHKQGGVCISETPADDGPQLRREDMPVSS
jgi:hypothetical protein